MKNIKQYIKEEIKRLSERQYDAPSEILDALENRLELNPLNRYISHLKSVNSVPPSYEINLHNGEKFYIIYEDYALLAKIGSKEYYLVGDVDEKNYAIKHINRLLTGPKIGSGEEEMGDEGGAGPIGGPPPPPSPPKKSGPPPPIDLPPPPGPAGPPEDEE
jgi:hypothetical protein